MCLTATDELAWWSAAFAIDPDAWKKKGPLRVATSAMIARKDRIFFIDTPFSACRSSKR
jgi:hypothetical protein